MQWFYSYYWSLWKIKLSNLKYFSFAFLILEIRRRICTSWTRGCVRVSHPECEPRMPSVFIVEHDVVIVPHILSNRLVFSIHPEYFTPTLIRLYVHAEFGWRCTWATGHSTVYTPGRHPFFSMDVVKSNVITHFDLSWSFSLVNLEDFTGTGLLLWWKVFPRTTCRYTFELWPTSQPVSSFGRVLDAHRVSWDNCEGQGESCMLITYSTLLDIDTLYTVCLYNLKEVCEISQN